MKTISNDIFFAQIEELLSEGQCVIIRVKGHSMRPFMRSDRTSVRIAPLTDSERKLVSVGDIVLFRYRDHHIMHRIRRIEEDRITLAGDGNYRLWEHCSHDDIVGMVTDVMSYKGRSISCNSRLWRNASTLWLAIPQILRRVILAILAKLGVK